MSLIEDIFESLGLGDITTGGKSKITIIDDVGAYIDSVKSIKSYSKDEIILLTKNAEIIIKGKDLMIKKYCEGDVAICGKITSLEKI